MAYLKIISDKTHRKIGEMRLVDNQNIIFDTKGNVKSAIAFQQTATSNFST